MTESPAVTVCIPTYNRRKLLAASLQSVREQSFGDVEIIVSDNASTDDTGDYVRSLNDPRIRYDRLAENVGLFGNLSRCLRLGSGRYRVVLPDDDLMLPGNLEAKVRFLDENPSAGMVHSGFRYLDEHARPIGAAQHWSRLDRDTLEPGESFVRRSLALGGIVCVPSVMLRSALVADEKFDADDGPYADIALWLRIGNRSDVGFLIAPLSGYLVHASSASSGFSVVEVRGGRHRMTQHHADAVLRAHSRFVQHADLDPRLRAELGAVVADADRRLRWTLRANQVFSPAQLTMLKKLAGWAPGSAAHKRLSLDGTQPVPGAQPAVGVHPRAEERPASGGEDLAGDVCVIGAGPAGLTVALTLAEAGVRVILLEGGGSQARLLTDIRQEGEPAYPQSDVTQTRASGLGGTSGLWSYRMANEDADPQAGGRGCRYAPLDPSDFEARPEVPHSGWPLTRADLDPWYAKAQSVCGLGRFDYTPAGWSTPSAAPLPLDPGLVETQMFQFGPATAWTTDAVSRLRAASGVEVLTGTNVVELESDPAGTRVTAVHWRRDDGTTGTVRARCTVLAAGGIENSRLLLLSDRQVRGGLGNGTSQVGRYWMEHPLVRGGLLVAPSTARLAGRLRLYDAFHHEGTKVMAKLSVSPRRVRSEGLLSTSAMLIPRDEVLAGMAFQAYTAARSPTGRAASLATRAALAARIAAGSADLVKAHRTMATDVNLDLNGWSARPDAGRFRVFEIVHQTEQSPDPDNRVVLGTETDRFNRRIPVLQWAWSTRDRDRVTWSRNVYDRAFTAAGLGGMIQKDWDAGRPRLLGGNHHHMGGTRMSLDPATGVVDVDAKVHGLANLFVAGSSVFPTGGSVNPTLTVVALSLRLAAHLQATLPHLPATAAAVLDRC